MILRKKFCSPITVLFSVALTYSFSFDRYVFFSLDPVYHFSSQPSAPSVSNNSEWPVINHVTISSSREAKKKNVTQLSVRSFSHNATMPGKEETDVDFMTRTSGFCGSSPTKCFPPHNTSRIVRVGVLSWAAHFNLGAYSCPLTRCILYKHERGQVDYDVLLNTFPTSFPFPPLKSLRTRHAEISMESSINHPSAATPRKNVNLFIRYQPPKDANRGQFLPTSYINTEMDDFLAQDNDDNRWLDHEFREPAIAVVISNCNTRSKRVDILTEILKSFPRVFKLGKCFQGDKSSQVLPATLQKCLSLPRRSPMWDKPKECILKHVMFVFSVENSFEYGYITEKMWQPLKMGAIPVYSIGSVHGNRNYLPHPDAALMIEDFESVEQLARYMHQVAKNRTLWFKHAKAWRYLPTAELSMDFFSAVNNSLVTLPCRLCDWWSTDTRED
mmetsp:Transcript_8141/g.19857  ORF Transcript_8141/g.19857 Transcript_8141/m.19857 type:complete len:443 (-) Transcript_8141:636-1964(-)